MGSELPREPWPEVLPLRRVCVRVGKAPFRGECACNPIRKTLACLLACWAFGGMGETPAPLRASATPVSCVFAVGVKPKNPSFSLSLSLFLSPGLGRGLPLTLSLSLPALGFRAVRAHPPARERAAAVRCAERIFLVGGYLPPRLGLTLQKRESPDRWPYTTQVKPSITVTEAPARIGGGIKRNGDLGQKRALPPCRFEQVLVFLQVE